MSGSTVFTGIHVLRFHISEVVRSVEDAIAKNSNALPWLICAKLQDNGDNAASILTILSAIVARLDAGFMQRIWERKRLIHVTNDVNIGSAIEIIAGLISRVPFTERVMAAGKAFALPWSALFEGVITAPATSVVRDAALRP